MRKMGYIKGIDISNNNGTIDFSQALSDGVEYVYVKATEGKTFQDRKLEGFYNECKRNNLKVGPYHFLVGTSSPEAQAENFYKKIKDFEWELIPMLDIESEFEELCDYVLRFINTFKELSPLQLGIYTYTGFIANMQEIENTIKDYPFWEANYNNDPWNLPSNFFTNRIGHQYTETGEILGVSGKCDVNSFTEGVLLKNATIDDAMKTGWCYDENSSKWYYFNEEGIMQTGWVQVDDKWYHLDNNGVMEKGWLEDDGKEYCFYSNGEMIRDCDMYGYRFDENGVAVKLS
jgi:lysozyme